MTKVQNNSKSPESLYAWLSLKWVLNSLSNFKYEKVGKITSLRPLLGQPYITTKIVLNIVKVVVHTYLPNVQINLRSNFNSKNLVKSETPLCGFAKVGLKEGENILESLKSLHAHLLIKLAPKFMIKFKF